MRKLHALHSVSSELEMSQHATPSSSRLSGPIRSNSALPSEPSASSSRCMTFSISGTTSTLMRWPVAMPRMRYAPCA